LQTFHSFELDQSYEKFANCTQLLLLYVQPDEGHNKGRNM